MVVVVAFSSRARILGECSTIHSPPALLFFSGDYLAHTNSTVYARISPQWLSELRRLANKKESSNSLLEELIS